MNSSADGPPTAGGKPSGQPGKLPPKPPKKQPVRRTADEVQEWLVKHLSEAMEVDPAAIDVSAPFETLGLDSVTAIGMTGKLEEWLGVSIDPTVIYDYPTIEELAEYLAKLTSPD